MTREIRRTQGEKLTWPPIPKILFVAASPPGIGNIPLDAHLLALRAVVDAWMKYYNIEDREMYRKQLDEHLVFLPSATIEAIEKLCSTNTFTHVHILAHGAGKLENYDTRFYLALHNSLDPNQIDYISGSRLATALRPSQRPHFGELAKPAVVTLASCDSGNVGSVAGAGSSIAHALHEAGIPIVVAGQFPLSFEGSVTLVDCLYSGLLWGIDPRPLLYDLRRRLYARYPDRHDWASLVAYVSLPPDFDQQLEEIKINQALRSIEAAMNHGDEATENFFEPALGGTESTRQPGDDTTKILLETAREKMTVAKNRLYQLLDKLPSKRARILSLLASTEKRHAEILYSTWESQHNKKKKNDRDHQECKRLLLQSRDHYWDTFVEDKANSWPLVQYLSLTLLIERSADFSGEGPADPAENKPENTNKNLILLWARSTILCMFDLEQSDKEKIIWAYGNLIELHLLRMVLPEHDDHLPTKDEARLKALEYTNALVDAAGRSSFSIYSTRRQILRYTGWFSRISDIGPLKSLAEEILQIFPGKVEKEWK